MLQGSKKDKWFLDNGCSRHMTGDEFKFAFLTKKNGGYVTFGDNAKRRIIGQGNIGNGTSVDPAFSCSMRFPLDGELGFYLKN